jgi:hypothetical protein
VKRVFGEPYEKDGVTVIPAASIRGGAGGGRGEGGTPDGKESGSGSAGGFGLTAKPAGVYVNRRHQGELATRRRCEPGDPGWPERRGCVATCGGSCAEGPTVVVAGAPRAADVGTAPRRVSAQANHNRGDMWPTTFAVDAERRRRGKSPQTRCFSDELTTERRAGHRPQDCRGSSRSR